MDESCKKVLFLSRDRGSVQAILPVILALKTNPALKLHVVSMVVSRPLLEQYGIRGEALDEVWFAQDPAGCVDALLDLIRPSLVVSGSSPARGQAPETPEQFLILAAGMRSIPTIAILDAWGLYLERFSRAGNSVDLDLVPDRLCVLDRICRDELIELGLPAGRILVTHNPWLDRYLPHARRETMHQGNKEKRGWKVLFVSQPLAETSTFRSWPYDQVEILLGLLSALTHVGKNKSHEVIIWAHQNENPRLWDDLTSYQRANVNVLVNSERGKRILSTVDLVVTSHSTIIYEALHYEIPCISYRPRGYKLAPLITERIGLCPTFTDEDSLITYLCVLNLAVEKQRLSELRKQFLVNEIFFNDGMATSRVIQEIYDTIGI